MIMLSKVLKACICLSPLFIALSLLSQFKEMDLSHNQLQSEWGSALEHKSIYHSKYKNIRIAAFGTSDTYGAGIHLPHQERTLLTYPHLLSPKAKNYAIRASSPNYPRACVQSMIENSFDRKYSDSIVFDVIVLDYFIRGHTGLIPLVQRLRERYPDAVIIILREWNPLMHVYRDTVDPSTGVTKSIHAYEWVKQTKIDLYDKEKLKQAVVNDDPTARWKWVQIKDDDKIAVQEEAARRFDAYILPMERPARAQDFIDYIHLFSEDYHHKSIEGHAEVAERIHTLARDFMGAFTPSKRLGQWSFKDNCVSWFQSGDTTGVQFSSDSIELEEFSNKGGPKYALSFTQGTGTVTVTNPSNHPMDLYLTYMSMGPGSSNYPNTEVEIIPRDTSNEQDQQSPTKILLDSKAPRDWNHINVHVQKMIEIGTIAPGETTLRFNALDKTMWPFRLVAAIITQNQQFAPDDEQVLQQDDPYSLTSIPGHEINFVD